MTASNTTEPGSAPRCCETRCAPARTAQTSSCSPAAARNVSAPARLTRVSLADEPPGELADRGRLARAVDPDHDDHAEAFVREREPRVRPEDRDHLLSEQRFRIRFTSSTVRERARRAPMRPSARHPPSTGCRGAHARRSRRHPGRAAIEPSCRAFRAAPAAAPRPAGWGSRAPLRAPSRSASFRAFESRTKMNADRDADEQDGDRRSPRLDASRPARSPARRSVPSPPAPFASVASAARPSGCSSRWQRIFVVPSLFSETPYIIEPISIVRFWCVTIMTCASRAKPATSRRNRWRFRSSSAGSTSSIR